MAEIKAKGGAFTVTGRSGNGDEVWKLIRAAEGIKNTDAPIFRAMLGHPDFTTPKNGEKRTGSSCAEPHAVAQLLAKGVSFKNMKLEMATDQNGSKMAECHFCAQWIHPDGKIDADFMVEKYVTSPGVLPDWCYF